MKILCQYALGNEDKRLICSLDEDHSLCDYQRYCTKDSEWQNTNAFSNCNKRGMISMDKKFEVATPVAEKKTVAKKIKIKGKVIVVTENFSVVKTYEKGNITLIPAQGEIGQEIEIEVDA